MKPLPLALPLLLLSVAAHAAVPRIAVWNPESSAVGSRFALRAPFLDTVAGWLREDGCDVARPTTAQVADPATFSADRFDALMLEGDAFPSANLDVYQRFLDDGGVLVALAAASPFEMKIAQTAAGAWRLDPESPNFAWQTKAVHELLGLTFDWRMEMVYSGVHHTPTELFQRYLPGAPPVEKSLLARWLFPKTGTIYPLMRSRQADGGDYTPQLYIAANGKRRAILCAGAVFTGEANPKLWPLSRKTVLALANISRDLRAGALDLSACETANVPTELVLAGPLANRRATAGIEPEGATPAVRWGRYNGSRLEFGPTLPTGQRRAVAVGAPPADVPGALDAGAGIDLALPPLPAGPLYLRIRGAVRTPGVTLRAALDDTVVWHETLLPNADDTAVNLGHRYGGAATEFTRILFLPPALRKATTLHLANAGVGTLCLDALQIETRTLPARRVELGLHTGVGLAYDNPTALTPEMVRDWSVLRCTTRTWWIGKPDDPKQWDRFDRHVERYLALHPRCQFIFEGTPEWAAISADRYAGGGDRKHMTPPDLDAYAALVERIVAKYADRVQDWELWNEANIRHFWAGSNEEYAAFFARMAPIIKRLDPDARVIVAGMAGVTDQTVDPFAAALAENGALRHADLFAMHCYAPAGRMDLPYGLLEGHLLSLGSDIEIYANEQGYVWKAASGWQPDQADKSPAGQRNLYNIGMARLMACGVSKVTDFNGGGDENDLGLIDGKGSPRPAYAVFADYLHLAGPGARRVDVALAAPDGSALCGVYVTASARDDGVVTLVVNPAEVVSLQAVAKPDQELNADEAGRWSCFFGKAAWNKADGTVTVTPDPAKGYAGFFTKLVLDPARNPEVEIDVPITEGKWTLQMKFGSGDDPLVFTSEKSGTLRARYADSLKNPAARTCEISLRIYGKSSTFNWIRFPAPELATPPARLPVVLTLPLPKGGDWRVTAESGGAPVAATLTVHASPDGPWAAIKTDLAARTVLRLTPAQP